MTAFLRGFWAFFGLLTRFLPAHRVTVTRLFETDRVTFSNFFNFTGEKRLLFEGSKISFTRLQ